MGSAGGAVMRGAVVRGAWCVVRGAVVRGAERGGVWTAQRELLFN